MKKRVYHYEIDLETNYMEKIKILSKNYNNYMIIHQCIDKSKYTYIGLKPKEYIYTGDNYLNIYNKTQFMNKKGDYIRHLIQWLNKNEIEIPNNLPPFIGGAMGYITDTLYDYYNKIITKTNTPNICFMIFDEVLIIDHNRNKLGIAFIGDYNYEYYYSNLFNKWVEEFNKISIEKTNAVKHFNLKFDEIKIISRYKKVFTKFIDEKYFFIKTNTKVLIDTNHTSFDLFLSLIDNSEGSQCALFKTNDYTTIVASKENFIKKADDVFNVSISDELTDFEKDIMINQVCRLNHIKSLDASNILINCKNISLDSLLKNFTISYHNYGIPFNRMHSYIRRNENEYNFSGFIGWIGYDNNFVLSNIEKPIIYNRENSYINIGNFIHNNLTEKEYLKEFNKKVDLILEKFVL